MITINNPHLEKDIHNEMLRRGHNKHTKTLEELAKERLFQINSELGLNLDGTDAGQEAGQ